MESKQHQHFYTRNWHLLDSHYNCHSNYFFTIRINRKTQTDQRGQQAYNTNRTFLGRIDSLALEVRIKEHVLTQLEAWLKQGNANTDLHTHLTAPKHVFMPCTLRDYLIQALDEKDDLEIYRKIHKTLTTLPADSNIQKNIAKNLLYFLKTKLYLLSKTNRLYKKPYKKNIASRQFDNIYSLIISINIDNNHSFESLNTLFQTLIEVLSDEYILLALDKFVSIINNKNFMLETKTVEQDNIKMNFIAKLYEHLHNLDSATAERLSKLTFTLTPEQTNQLATYLATKITGKKTEESALTQLAKELLTTFIYTDKFQALMTEINGTQNQVLGYGNSNN